MKFKAFVFFLILPFLKNISSHEVDEDHFSVISTSKPAIENDKINERLSRVEFYLEIRSALKVLQESITEMQKTKRQYIDEVEAVLEKKLQNYRGEIQGLKEHLTETKNEIEQNVQNQLTEMKQEIRDEMKSVKEDLQKQLTETKREINAENEKLSSKIGDTQNEIIEKVSKMLNEAVLEDDRNNKKYFEEIKNEIIDNHNSEKSRIVEELETVRNQLKQTQANITTETEDCKNLPQDCSEVQKRGNKKSGVYRIHPQFTPDDFLVWCDMTTKGGGWAYVVNRFDGSQSFFLNWTDYKKGFGKLSGEHWLGLQHLHELTYNKANELLVELMDFDLKKVYARYSRFKIGNESEDYIVEDLGYWSGDVRDSLGIENMKFSTPDRKNDKTTGGYVPCAKLNACGWWFRACWTSLLTGRYRNFKSGDNYYFNSAIKWDPHINSSFKEARMMIRPLNV